MQIIVAVLRGGTSNEHGISLQTGATMIAALPREQFEVRDIYIDRAGHWHDRGKETTANRVLRQIDVVLNGLHGAGGENGKLQRLLGRFAVPYTGSDDLGSYFAMHKVIAKTRAKAAGLLTPDFRYVENTEDSERVAKDVLRSFMQPVVVKPIGWGSSVGIAVVGGYEPVLKTIQALFKLGAPGVLIEEKIRGNEATAGVVEKMRNEALYALPVVEVAHGADLFSHEAKTIGKTKMTCPGRFSRVETEELKRAAKLMHRTLGLRHYSRSDFIVSPRGIYYLETNSLPALAPEAPMARALATIGISPAEFTTHILKLALQK